jgi:hypothetical protein
MRRLGDAMKKKSGIHLAVVSAFVAAFGMSGLAWAEDELEQPDAQEQQNYPATSAQPLTVDGSGTASVNGFLGTADADVYSFTAKKGDTVTFDIDFGVKEGAGPGTVDTFLTILGPDLTVLWKEDDGLQEADEGSVEIDGFVFDTYLSGVTIPADGTYYVAVTDAGSSLTNGGVFEAPPPPMNGTGTYTLLISGLASSAPAPDPVPDPVPAPQTRTISIDIKPSQGGIARIYPASHRSIPVALLSASDFNALAVDKNSLTFGQAGDEQSLRGCYKHGIDVNRDGLRDLVCHFDYKLAGFELTDNAGILRGSAADGTPIEGKGWLKVIPQKRKGHRWHGDRRHGHNHHDGHRSHKGG